MSSMKCEECSSTSQHRLARINYQRAAFPVINPLLKTDQPIQFIINAQSSGVLDTLGLVVCVYAQPSDPAKTQLIVLSKLVDAAFIITPP